MMKKPIDMSWDELQAHLDIFDRIEVNFYDGGVHKPFSGDSGIQVLRVTGATPQKNVKGEVTLNIQTDANFFGSGVHRIIGDKHIKNVLDNTSLSKSDKEEVLKALGVDKIPSGEPFITSN